MDRKHTETTRLLCAAAYYDWSLRDTIIEHFLNRHCKALQAAAGLDLVPVLKHCLAARRLKDRRDIALGLCTIVIATLAWFSGSPVARLLCAAAGYLAALCIVAMERWTSEFRIAAGQLSESTFDPNAAPIPEDIRAQEALKTAAELRDANVSVYTGFIPFAVCGMPVGGWAFAIEAEKPKNDGTGPLPVTRFSVQELYDYIESSLVALEIPGLTVADQLFVRGVDVRRDPRFLADSLRRPVLRVPLEIIREFVGNSSERVRQFKWIRVMSWNGNLIFSIILNLSRLGTKLYVEADYYLLGPVRETYRKVDRLANKRGWRAIVAAFSDVPITAFLLGLISPALLASKAVRPLIAALEKRSNLRRARTDPDYDYGSERSIRYWASGPNYEHYFQKVDKERYVKVLERQLLDAILQFLDARNIDTSDLKERQTSILNSGVIVSGGVIETQNLAVGESAQAGAPRRAKKKVAAAVSKEH